MKLASSHNTSYLILWSCYPSDHVIDTNLEQKFTFHIQIHTPAGTKYCNTQYFNSSHTYADALYI
jgi:hypothetical protein